MTTKKELRQRLDLHTAEITQLYQQLDSTQSAVFKIHELADSVADRENNRQNKIQSIVDDVATRLQRIGELVTELTKQDAARISKIEQQLATQEEHNEKRLDLHSKSLCDLHDKIDSAEEKLRRLEQNLATVERQTDNQTAWNNAAQEKISAVERIIVKLQHAFTIQDKWNDCANKEIRTIEQTILAQAKKNADLHQLRDKETLDLYTILASIQKQLSNKEQQPNAKRPHIPAGKLQRKPTTKQTNPPKTSPAPTKTKLPTNTRAKRPATQRRGRTSPRTNPS